MKIDRKEDGFQLEDGNVLVTFRASPNHPHGFGGNVLVVNPDGSMTEVSFHGDNRGGVCCHNPKPYKMEAVT